MDWLMLTLAAVVLLFGFVVLFGAPFLPTLKKQLPGIFDLLDLKPGQTLLELGCGDGRVLRYAASLGIKSVGYELNPVLVIVARLRTFKYRRQVRVVWGNYWTVKWPQTDGIFVFLLDRYMSRLDKNIVRTYSGKNVKLVSLAFKIPGKKYTKKRGALFLYDY